MFTFSKVPYFWFIWIYIVGILLVDQLPGNFIFALTLLLSTCIFIAVIQAIVTPKWWFYPMIILLILLIAIVRYLQFHDGQGHRFSETQQTLENVTFRFMILENEGDKRFSRRIAKITKIDAAQKALFGQKILLNFRNDHNPPEEAFTPGQMYENTCHISPIPVNGNPSSFDYKKYMHAQNIHFQAYPDTSTLVYLGNEGSFSPFLYFSNVRQVLVKMIGEQLPGESSAALVSALTLGDISGLDASTLTRFSNTGARHILTVSGMHVGIIMLILMLITSPLKKPGLLLRIIRSALLFSGLWLYIFLIGAQPAVLRAGFMLSIYLLGSEIRKSQNSINTLSFSAFILLLINPMMVFQLSFIFTYLALFSILVFYKPVYGLVFVKNKVLRYFWQLCSLSLAAQILMMPVSAFYFHTAPLYFLLTGIIATPAALAIFSLTLVFFLEQFIFVGNSNIFGVLLDFISRLFLDSVKIIDSIPHSSLQNIWITHVGLFLIVMIVLMFSIALLSDRKSFVFYGLATIAIAVGYRYYHQSELDKHEEICIYSDKNGIMIDLFINRICYSIISDTLSKADQDFVNKSHRMRYGIEKVVDISIQEYYADQHIVFRHGLLTFNNCRIQIYPSGQDIASPRAGPKDKNDPIPVSIQKVIKLRKDNIETTLKLMLISDANTFLKDRETGFDSYLMVLPADLPIGAAKTIKKKLAGQPTWDIKEQGALRIIWK